MRGSRRAFLVSLAPIGAACVVGSADAGVARTGDELDKAAAARELAAHRIVKIAAQRVRDRYPRSLGPNARLGPHGRGGSYQVRIIVTDKGATGWAMCYLPDEAVRPFVGAKVGDLFDLEVGAAPEAGALENPLHDLAANILRVPVWKMLGAAGPRRVPVYSGAIYMEDLMPRDRPGGLQAVLDACLQDYGAGYRAFKLKIGRGYRWMPKEEGLQRDITVTRAVREKFPDCRILVDANDGFTVDEAIRYVQAVADCDLYWIEEPFEEHEQGLRRLKEAMAKAGCKARIADGERRRERAKQPARYGGYTQEFGDHILRLGEAGLVDVCVMDPGIVGFTRWRKLLPELKRPGLSASPHLWAWTPRTYYCAQLAAGLDNICIVEGIPGGAPEIDYSAYRFVNGALAVPDTPGFGLRLKKGTNAG